MASLIVLTTSGGIDYLKGALASLDNEWNDILIIDDGSKADYSELKKDYKIIIKDKGKGLTHTWNMAYRYFKSNNYDKCLITNDDVIFPSKIPPDMWNGLDKYTFIGPLSDPIGSGRFLGQFQNVSSYLGGIRDYRDVITIQNRLQKKHKNYLEIGRDIILPREEPPYINGFCFSFNRDIIDSEFSKDILFDPSKINTGNEKELQLLRLKDKKVISIKSYVYHYKGQSFNKNRQEIIN